MWAEGRRVAHAARRVCHSWIWLAFHLEGMFAIVSLPDGRRMLREDLAEEELARRDEEIERLRRLLDERG